MDKQRVQAYYQLIQQLLSCADGEESGILAANTNLLDAEFLQLLEVGVAQMSTQEGHENRANRLMWLASQLNQALNRPLNENTPETQTMLSEADIETYLQFLLQVLQTTAESQGNPQSVYPLLAANTDKLNLIFAQILRAWATKTLEEAEPEKAQSIAIYIGEFSNLIQQFPLGNKANNMEIGIAGYEIALTVFTRQISPKIWATLQNNLGNAYRNRIMGDKADNLENAIAAYEQALEVRTRYDFPVDWAITQNNLGTAYSNRIMGDRAENLKNAIAAYEQALKVTTRTDFPVQWATTQNNLGNAYLYRIRGDKAENLEYAIAAYEQALKVTTRTNFPVQWATTQNNLGNAYSDRISGDKAENLEYAIAAYEQALKVYTSTDFPVDWATTQNNLGNAYSDRISGDKAENLEYAIAAYEQALKVTTRTDFPLNWATTQNNLGNAYRNRIRGDKAENLEYAIAAYEQALEVYTRTNFPVDWAMTQNNLGNAYSDRIRGDKAENLKNAIAAYTAALEVYTCTDFPQQWKTVQNNLASAYSNKTPVNQLENIDKNIPAYSSRLESLFQIGTTFQEIGEDELAYTVYKSAIQEYESLRKNIPQEEGKRKFSEDWNKLFMQMVEVCLRLGKETEAISYIERSKTRNLVELISEKVSFIPIQYPEIQNLLDDKTAIIQFYIFNDCFRAFIITHDNDKPIIWQSTESDLNQLLDLIYDQYLTLYYEDRKKWSYQLNNQLNKLAEILQLNQIISQVPPHIQKIIIIPHRYLHLLPFHAIPLSTGECLIDKYPDGVSYAPSCQLLKFAQKPLSNSLLQGERTRLEPISNSLIPKEKTRLNNLFAIQNPTNDLKFTDIEVETIANNFNPHCILKHEQASKSAFNEHLPLLTNSQWLHFSCHGSFNLDSPLKSALQLAKSVVKPDFVETSPSRYVRVDAETAIDLEKCLTLEEILKLKLSQCYLVCLSACETGVIDFSNNSDEYIGLSSGFIKAGATNIVSSLWSVSDFHTSLLMIKLYENISQNPDDITLALNQAQQWLRQATQTQIIDWLNNKTDMNPEQKQQIIDLLSQQYKPEQKPFYKPEFWAGFCAVSPVKFPV